MVGSGHALSAKDFAIQPGLAIHQHRHLRGEYEGLLGAKGRMGEGEAVSLTVLMMQTVENQFVVSKNRVVSLVLISRSVRGSAGVPGNLYWTCGQGSVYNPVLRPGRLCRPEIGMWGYFFFVTGMRSRQ